MTSDPLPWCERLNTPYWQVNFILCTTKVGWREKQKGKAMAEIIPWIDEMVERGYFS
jgi:hypothetical protein